MWVLKTKANGEQFLTYDKTKYRDPFQRGSWEYVGPQSSPQIEDIIRFNKQTGLQCVKDDEGGVRVLVLQD
jgi:hypothetical protein